MTRGGYSTARRSLMELASRWPGKGEPLFLLGQCEELSGHPNAAKSAWEQVKPGDPSFIAALESLGSLLIKKMPLAENNDMVKAIPSDRTDEPLCKPHQLGHQVNWA